MRFIFRQVLESNMSISSQYLEELSRRYKRQMEELQRQFNITILALNKTSQTAYERDLYHQKKLESLESQLEALTKAVSTLVEEKENLPTQVVEQHIILLFVELVVMFLAFTFCMRRRREEALPRATAHTDAEGKIGSGTGSEECLFVQAEADAQGRETPSFCRRRSVDSIRSESEAKPKERRLSGHLDVTGMSFESCFKVPSSSGKLASYLCFFFCKVTPCGRDVRLILIISLFLFLSNIKFGFFVFNFEMFGCIQKVLRIRLEHLYSVELTNK